MADAATFHEEEALGKAYDAKLMRRLLKYLRPYTLHVAGGTSKFDGAVEMDTTLLIAGARWCSASYCSTRRHW